MQRAGTRHAQGGSGGRLGSFDAHIDGNISRAYLRRLHPRKTLPGPEYVDEVWLLICTSIISVI